MKNKIYEKDTILEIHGKLIIPFSSQGLNFGSYGARFFSVSHSLLAPRHHTDPPVCCLWIAKSLDSLRKPSCFAICSSPPPWTTLSSPAPIRALRPPTCRLQTQPSTSIETPNNNSNSHTIKMDRSRSCLGTCSFSTTPSMSKWRIHDLEILTVLLIRVFIPYHMMRRPFAISLPIDQLEI